MYYRIKLSSAITNKKRIIANTIIAMFIRLISRLIRFIRKSDFNATAIYSMLDETSILFSQIKL